MRKIELTEREVSAIVFWLSESANKKWRSGSSTRIEEIYNKLNAWLHTSITPKRWKWLE